MAEKFRIDLGYDQLFGSQSIDPDSSTGTNKTVVYDTAKQTFYYTGSYGGGGGGGEATTGSFTGSFTGSIDVNSNGDFDEFPIVFVDDDNILSKDILGLKFNPNQDRFSVGGHISSSAVTASSFTGSFTGSFNGFLSGTVDIKQSNLSAVAPILFSDGGDIARDSEGGSVFGYQPSTNVFKYKNSKSTGSIDHSGSLNITGSTISSGSLTISGSTISSGSLTITGSTISSGSLTTNGPGGNISASATSSGLYGFFRSGSNIGPAEDSTYTDGLFTDFTHETLIGTPIDRFNEVLKALAPSPAPNLSSLGDNESTFTSCSVSFGGDFEIDGVSNVEVVGNLPALLVSGTFDSTRSFDGGEDYRLGINNNISAQSISGKLNQAAAEDGGSGVTVNFSASAFGEANVGQLFLYVNTGGSDGGAGTGTPTVSVNLESSNGAISADNTNATLTVGATSSGFFPQGTEFTNFTHRTGSYEVKAAAQRNGMNFIRVIHTSSTFQRSTNYIQFLNATQSSADITFSSDGSPFTGSGTKYLSGVKYHTDGRLDYTGSFSNYYKIVAGLSSTALNIEISGPTNLFEVARLFQSGSNTKVSTGTTSNKASSTPLQEQVGNTHLVPLTFSASISGGLARANYYSLIVDNNDTTEDLVIRTDLSTVPNNKISGGTNIGTKTYRGLLLDARTIANNGALETLQSESFVSESYRLRTLAFDTQGSVTTSGNKWASVANILTTSNLTGLLVMPRWESGGEETNGGGMLAYPDSNTVPESGDFSSFTNGPSGNPDYSGASGNLTYLRAFRNQSTNDLASFTLFLRSWSSTIDILASGSGGTTLQGNDIFLEVKLPGDTGFLDIGGAAQNSTDDLTADGAPGRLGTLTSIGTSATGFVVQTKNAVSGEVVHDDDYIVVKITAAQGFIRTIRSIGITDFIA